MPHQKTYGCQRCDRFFARSEHLQRHERSHTKEKPFHCVICTKAFTRKDLLRRHTRLSHISREPYDATGHSSISPSLPNEIENESMVLSPAPRSRIESSDQSTTVARPAQTNSCTYVPDLGHAINFNPSLDSNGVNLEYVNQISSQGNPSNPSNNDFDLSTCSTDNFMSFLDNISMPNYPYSPAYQPLPQVFDFESQMLPSSEKRTDENIRHDNLPADGCRTLHSRLGSRLPSLQPEECQTTYRSALEAKTSIQVSSQRRDRMISSLEKLPDLREKGFTLPSRHTLSRFISGYFTGFHDHYPFLHIATFDVESTALELILAISALGAQYCREPDQGLELFHMAKFVAMDRIHSSNSSWSEETPSEQVGESAELGEVFPNTETPAPFSISLDREFSMYGNGNMEVIQSLLLLIAVATWFQQKPPFHEALSLRSVLDTLVREKGLEQPESEDHISWERWIYLESAKRTKFIVFCFFNIHTIIFDLPPMLLSDEIKLNLPCTEREWKANSMLAWEEARSLRNPEPNFQDALQSLFDEDINQRSMTSFSSLGGYVLIHALILQIWLLRQVARLPPRKSLTLPVPETKSLEHALHRWRHCWERNQESSLDPLSPHGPLAFTSTALLRLAYIRTSTDVSSARLLSTWSPRRIARSLLQSPPTQRGDRVTRAALHCAHALSIPINLGINFVAQTQVVLWSNQHALCSLECAFLLTNWLQSVTKAGLQPGLTEQETRLLDFVVELVMETEFKADRGWLLENNKRMSAIVARLWAKLFRSDGIWEMVSLIGKSLNIYADLLHED